MMLSCGIDFCLEGLDAANNRFWLLMAVGKCGAHPHQAVMELLSDE